MKKNIFLIACIFYFLFSSQTHAIPYENLIPTPVNLKKGAQTYVLPSNITIGYSHSSLKLAAQYLQNTLSGFKTSIIQKKNTNIFLYLDKKFNSKKGAYQLAINKTGIKISAADYEGIINGMATLRQLFSENKNIKSLPIIMISDSPRFGWRGLMLDVSRHFLDKNEVKSMLDLMSLYKLNKLHWHLTDDQGWRIEIKKYPLLTERSAWRKFNSHDRECMYRAKTQDNTDFLIPEKFLKINNQDTLYGGFYTQNDIKEVVAYANKLGIEVIPELDMPGHSLAAINAYNWLVCNGKYGWGSVFSSPLCPGKDEVMEFCKNVYAEVFTLFPSKYVHIGGDEVEKHNWKTCSDCQKRIKKEGLTNEEELQGWFIRQMEKYFNQNGKILIGWDEVLNDGLNNNSVIMWWRTWVPEVPTLAEKQGKKMILCPGEYYYFDAAEDKYSIPKMLASEPLQTRRGNVQESSVMGVQANLWAEWIPSLKRLQYMLVPRLFALSELAWSSPEKKMNLEEYKKRSVDHFKMMDGKGINYRIPDADGYFDTNVFTDKHVSNITAPMKGIKIKYTTDGTNPTILSPELKKGIVFNKSTQLKFRQFRPNGTPDNIISTSFLKTDLSESISFEPPNEFGVNAYISEYKGNYCDSIVYFKVKEIIPLNNFKVPSQPNADFSMILKSYILIPADGIYSFALLSDDGSILKISSQIVINNDGLHPPFEKTGQAALRKGWHEMELSYFDKSGGTLKLQLLKDGKWQQIPDEWLKRR